MAFTPIANVKYPQEALPDYMILTAHTYTPRNDRVAREVLGPAVATIRLPIPDLPTMVSSQKYGPISGALNDALFTALGQGYEAIDTAATSGNTAGVDVESIAQQLQERVKGQVGPVLREMAAGAAGSLMGINSIQFQSGATGQFSNPQIELLYAGPTLRAFPFSWTLAPKSETEAASVKEIIRRFKYHSLPQGNAGAGMLKTPDVWSLKFYVQDRESPAYQKIFTCALESVSVKQNAAGSHLTTTDGQPLVTTISTTFKEIKIRTTADYETDI